MIIQNPPVPLNDHLWMLGSTAYPFYLHCGSRGATLFEGGISLMGPVVQGQLAALGVGGDTVRQLIVTHAHPDHVMALPQLRQAFPAAQTVASASAAKTLATPEAIELFCRLDGALSDALVKAGKAAAAPPVAPGGQFAIDRVVKDGDLIEVDEGVAYQVLETPGHSECSLSFFEPRTKALIVSDATGYYLPQSQSWWPNYFSDYRAYVASMERLAALGAEVLCLSHNAAVRGADTVAIYFQGAIAATRQYHERILREMQGGQTVRQLAEVLGAEVYAQTPVLPLDFFQKNCGLLIKLSLKAAN
jgi:glyoxylase-like metal-dependent hydrolase (beta-lactamase superfamily II)